MIINILESLIAAYFFTNYFDLKINKVLYFLINFIVICSEICIFDSVKNYSIMLPLIVAVSASIIAIIFTKNDFWEILFITFLDQFIVGISIIFSLTLESIVSDLIRSVVGKLTYLLIVFIIIHIMKIKKQIRLKTLYWKLLTTVIVVFYFAYTILLEFYLGMEIDKGLVFISLVSLGLSVIGIAIIVYYISELEKKQQETQFSLQKLEMEQSNYKQLNEVAKELKIMRHDLKHDYLLIESYLNSNNYNKIKEIVSSRMKELNEKGYTVNSRNDLINTIINYKLMIANSKNIEVRCKLNVSSNLYMKDYHLNELLSNLLDNAIENCATKNPKIKINIEENVFLHIEIINNLDVSVLNNNPNLQTNKRGLGHGQGINSIKRIVDEYEGNIKFYEKGLEFYVSIIIPLNHPH